MTRPLEVWGTSHAPVSREVLRKLGDASWIGQGRAVVAASSRAAAARAFGLPARTLGLYGSTTGNPDDIDAAMSRPGQVFVCSMKGGERTYVAVALASGSLVLADEEADHHQQKEQTR